MSFNVGSIEGVLTLDRSPFNQGLALARRAAASFEGNRYEATIGEKGADKTAANIERVKRFAASLNGQNAVAKVDEKGGAKTIGVLETVKRAVASLSGKNATVDVGENGAAKTVASLGVVKKVAGSLDGKNINMIVDKDGAARNALTGIGSGLANIQPGLLALVTGLPSLVAGVALLVPVLVSAAGATLQLAAGLSQGLAGAAVIGGTALIGAAAGLGIYAKAVSSTVSASRGAYQALDKNAKKNLEMRRNQILNTSASIAFNKQLDRTSIALAGVQAEIGNRVFPAFTRLTALFTSSLPKLTPPLYRLVDGVTAVGESFVTSLLKGQRFGQLSRLLNFVASSGISAAKIIANIGTGLLAAIQPVLPASTRLLGNIRKLTAGFSAWANSARGARALSTGVAGLEKRMGQLWRVLANTSSGLAGLFGALGANNGIENILNGLIRLTAQFKNVTAEGSRGRKIIVSFMKDAQPILRETGAVVGTLVSQVFGLANALVHAKDKSTGMSVVAGVLKNIRDAIPPIRRLLQDTFIKLGPELGPLITNLAKLAETFAGQTPALVGFVHNINLVLKTFNRLPGPVKNNIANIVAMGAIMKATGAGAVLGFGTHLLSMLTITAAIRGKTGPAGVAVKALGGAARLAGRGVLGMGRFLARALPYIGRFAGAAGRLALRVLPAVSRVLMSLGTRALPLVIRLLPWLGRAFVAATGPVGIAVAAIALAAYIIYKNWKPISGFFSRLFASVKRIFRGAFASLPKPVQLALKTIWGIVRVGASVLKHIFTGDFGGAVAAGKKVFRSLPGPVQAAIRRVWSVLRAGAGVVSKIFRGDWKGAVNQALTIIGALFPGTRKWISKALSVVRAGGAFLKRLFSGDWRGAVNIALSVIGKLFPGVRGTINRVSAYIRAGVTLVKQIFSGDWRGAFNTALAIIGSLFPGVRRTIDYIGRYIKAGVLFVKQIFSGDWKGAINTALSIIGSFAPGVARAISGVISKITGMISDIKNYLRHTSLWQIGKDIVTGLANGIKSAAGAVLKALGGVVGGAVSAVKKRLHIKSPSRVFADIGFQIGKGLEHGIFGSVPGVEKAARHTADRLLGGFRGRMRERSPSREMYDSGVRAIEGLVIGLASMRRQARQSAEAIGGDLLSAVGAGISGLSALSRVAQSTGMALGVGLAVGARRAQGAVVSAMRAIADAALAAARARLRISSPSRVMFEMGVNTGRGLANGIRAQAEAVKQSVRVLMDRAIMAAHIGNQRLSLSLRRSAVENEMLFRSLQGIASQASPRNLMQGAVAAARAGNEKLSLELRRRAVLAEIAQRRASVSNSTASVTPRVVSAPPRDHITYHLGTLAQASRDQTNIMKSEFGKLREDNARLSQENLRMAKALTRSDYFVTAVDEANYVASTAEARRGGGK